MCLYCGPVDIRVAPQGQGQRYLLIISVTGELLLLCTVIHPEMNLYETDMSNYDQDLGTEEWTQQK